MLQKRASKERALKNEHRIKEHKENASKKEHGRLGVEIKHLKGEKVNKKLNMGPNTWFFMPGSSDRASILSYRADVSLFFTFFLVVDARH